MAKPTLGYRSVTEAVLALRAEGKTHHQIAEALDATPSEVINLAYKGSRVAKRRAGIDIPSTTLKRLRKAAVARGVCAERLAVRILNVVAIEGMIDSVLDDDPGAPCW